MAKQGAMGMLRLSIVFLVAAILAGCEGSRLQRLQPEMAAKIKTIGLVVSISDDVLVTKRSQKAVGWDHKIDPKTNRLIAFYDGTLKTEESRDQVTGNLNAGRHVAIAVKQALQTQFNVLLAWIDPAVLQRDPVTRAFHLEEPGRIGDELKGILQNVAQRYKVDTVLIIRGIAAFGWVRSNYGTATPWGGRITVSYDYFVLDTATGTVLGESSGPTPDAMITADDALTELLAGDLSGLIGSELLRKAVHSAIEHGVPNGLRGVGLLPTPGG